MKPFAEMTEDEKCAAVLAALVGECEKGSKRALRALGKLLDMPTRPTPTMEQIRAKVERLTAK